MSIVIATVGQGIVIAASSSGSQGPPGPAVSPGTAGQFYVTNAGATAPVWATISGGQIGASVATPGLLTLLQNSATTGNTLGWTGAAWVPSALNLAGGAGYVTGLLPLANQALQVMAGDVTGTTAASVVAKINGASVPAAGSLTTGNGPYVSGASALTYSALNLAGGSGWVTGVLPAANQAAQTMGGEVTGTTAASVVSGPFSTASLAWGTGIAAASLGTNKTSATLALQFGAGVTALKLDPAGTDTFYDSGSVARASISLTHGLFTAGGGGSDYVAAIGPMVGFETSNSALWLVPNGTALSATNYALENTSTSLYLNTISGAGAINFALGNTTYGAMNSGQWYFGGSASAASPIFFQWSSSTAPVLGSGTSATSLTVGTNKTTATHILTAGTNQTVTTLSAPSGNLVQATDAGITQGNQLMKSTNYTIDSSGAGDEEIWMTAACTITLPNPAGFQGRHLWIIVAYDPATGGGTIKRFGAEKINNATADITLVTADKFTNLRITTNNTDWVISRGTIP